MSTNSYNLEQNYLSKESLFVALMQLMATKDFKHLSISSVTQRAGVARSTFYRHYEILEDLLTEHLDDFFEAYKSLVEQNQTTNFELLRLLFAGLRQEKPFLTNLGRSRMDGLLSDKMFAFIKGLNIVCIESCPTPADPNSIRFVVGGICHVVTIWNDLGMVESDEQMAAIVSDRLVKHITKIAC